jgi:hypothetical protein
MPYGWKPQAVAPPPKILFDDFPSLGGGKPKTGTVVGAWGNGVATIRDAKDLPAPKPKISEQEQRRKRNAAARALFNSTGFIEAEDVTYLISDGAVHVIREEDEDEQDDDCTEMPCDDDWNEISSSNHSKTNKGRSIPLIFSNI